MNTIKDLRIETDRLVIRPYKEEDLMECYRLMQDESLFNYLDMEVMSLDEYKRLFYWLIGSYDKGFDENFKYSFNITLKESGVHIGWCGIGGLVYDHEQKEIYYLIGREYWGKGYAKEATVALRDYCFDTIGLKEIVALCKPDNIASKKVIENMGFKYRYKIEGLPKEFDFYNGEPYYLLTKEEYLKIMGKYTGSKNVFQIECEDIILREFQLEDLDAKYALTLQPEITEYLPDWIATKEKQREWMVNYEINENKEFIESIPNVPNISRHALRLGIILKETEEFIGWICSGLKDELPPPNREIGYAISKYYRGKGYATQAAKGLIRYIFEYTNIEVLNATALTYNTPSNRVIQKCGFKLIGTIVIDNQEYYHYKLLKNDWNAYCADVVYL